MSKEIIICLVITGVIIPARVGHAYTGTFNEALKDETVSQQAIEEDDLEIIRNRLIAELLDEELDKRQIEILMSTISNEGNWPDINYNDVSRTTFEQIQHVNNLTQLSRAYAKPGSEFHKNPELKQVIFASLDYWIENDFIADNWHTNEIANPRDWTHILLMMDSELTDSQIEQLLEMAGRANLNAWGARPGGDLIRIAGIQAKVALFERDEDLLFESAEVMAGQIHFTSGRGLKPDYSFHHRTDRVTSTLSYGTGYAGVFAAWALRLTDTQFSFPEKTLHLLTDFFIEGISRAMVHGHYRDPGSMNRGMSRPSALSAVGADLPEDLVHISGYREEKLRHIIGIRNGEIEPDITANRFFWHSEYLSHQRPEYFTSVRMYSARTNNMEAPHNQESLKHHHFADGANFISRTGREYTDIFSVLDWQKIPGTTVVQKPSHPNPNQIVKQGKTDFVGGVSDSTYGAAVFDFDSPHDTLTARKSWFFFDEEFVALGSAITSDSDYPVATTLNQSLLHGDVTVGKDTGTGIQDEGEHSLSGVSWVHHDMIAYLFPKPTDLRLENREFTGSWSSITDRAWARARGEEKKDLFLLWLDHGATPNSASYEYIVVPGLEADNVESYRQRAEIEILENTPEIQAVHHSGLNITQIVFYETGEIELPGGITLTAETPGLVMVSTDEGKIEKITVSDPTRKQDIFHLKTDTRFTGNTHNWKAAWKEEVSEIFIDLPEQEYAGKSVVLDRSMQQPEGSAPLFDPDRKTGIAVNGNGEQETRGHYIGQEFGGGVIYWVDETGERGLIAAKSDQSDGVRWHNGPARISTSLGDHRARTTNARGDGIGAGKMNTKLIVAQQTEDDFFGNFAAKVCADFQGGGYGDWYLPSKSELNLMYNQKDVIGGFANALYWSSTEYNIGFAWEQYFYGYGGQYTSPKGASRVRCIRKI